jgi:DNA-binding ferritin-like protein
MKVDDLKSRRAASPHTPTDLTANATRDLAAALNLLLADAFALYIKTKNINWHISGPRFRDHHLLLDEQADQIFAMTDSLAERVRKIGGTTLRSIGTHRAPAAPVGQRRRIRHAIGYVGGAARRQQTDGRGDAQISRRLLRA